jgi:hypothetical protein
MNRKLFIENLIPKYLRQEYPLFVNLLEEYYNYLDRSIGQLVSVKVIDKGKNYTNAPIISLLIIDNNLNSPTYGQYISDFKGASFSPYVVNGRLEKILVTNYGQNYASEDAPKIQISDTKGSGAITEPILTDSIGSVNFGTYSIPKTRFIDSEIEVFVEFLKKEYIPNLPKELYKSDVASIEVTKFVKFIKQFYNSKGIEDSVKFLYRILFNVDVNFYYPKVDMLRISDGKWQVDNILRLSETDPENLETISSQLIGNRILYIGSTGSATAIIENIVYDGSTGPHNNLYLSTLNGSFTSESGNLIYLYPITGIDRLLGKSYADGSTGPFFKTSGRYLNDDGFLDSTKRIQDSFYYQDFSYELQSEESITKFKGLLEEIIHPAGLKYFIRLNLENTVRLTSSVDSLTDIFTGADLYLDSELFPESYSLGPIFLDIDKNKSIDNPKLILDFSGSISVNSNTSYSTLSLISPNKFVSDPDEFTNASIIITDGTTEIYRIITNYDPQTGIVTLDNSFTTGVSTNSIIFRIINNFRFNTVTSNSAVISNLDSNYYIPYNPIPVTRLALGATSAAGATGFVMELSDNFNIQSGDLIRIDSEDLLVQSVTGSTGVWDIIALRGQNSTTPAVHSVGATAFNKTDKRFKSWRLFVTSGPGEGQWSKVISYGATGVITFDSNFTINTGSTGPNSNSTYNLYPDFSGSNSGYYTTGSTGITDITIVERGLGYTTGATGVFVSVVIDPPESGAPAIATATVGSSGEITGIAVIDPGTNYIFTPGIRILQIGATSPTINALAYTNIFNTNSPISQNSSYSQNRGVILSIPDAKEKFKRAFAVANLDNVTGTTVASCTVLDGGSGYTKSPIITFKKGGGGFGTSASATIINYSVSDIEMITLGNEYTTTPVVEIEEPLIYPGETILQNSTGARGIIEKWDQDLDLLYILKYPVTPDFDLSQINYRDINILVDNISGYYNTNGKQITNLSESEISVI